MAFIKPITKAETDSVHAKSCGTTTFDTCIEAYEPQITVVNKNTNTQIFFSGKGFEFGA